MKTGLPKLAIKAYKGKTDMMHREWEGCLFVPKGHPLSKKVIEKFPDFHEEISTGWLYPSGYKFNKELRAVLEFLDTPKPDYHPTKQMQPHISHLKKEIEKLEKELRICDEWEYPDFEKSDLLDSLKDNLVEAENELKKVKGKKWTRNLDSLEWELR